MWTQFPPPLEIISVCIPGVDSLYFRMFSYLVVGIPIEITRSTYMVTQTLFGYATGQTTTYTQSYHPTTLYNTSLVILLPPALYGMVELDSYPLHDWLATCKPEKLGNHTHTLTTKSFHWSFNSGCENQ